MMKFLLITSKIAFKDERKIRKNKNIYKIVKLYS